MWVTIDDIFEVAQGRILPYFIPYIHLVIKNSYHLLSNSSSIKALLSFSQPHLHWFEPVVSYSIQYAADLPTEPVEKRPSLHPRDYFNSQGLRTWSTTTWELDNYPLELLFEPLNSAWCHPSPHSFHPLQRSCRAGCKVLTTLWPVPCLSLQSHLQLLASHTQCLSNIYYS